VNNSQTTITEKSEASPTVLLPILILLCFYKALITDLMLWRYNTGKNKRMTSIIYGYF